MSVDAPVRTRGSAASDEVLADEALGWGTAAVAPRPSVPARPVPGHPRRDLRPVPPRRRSPAVPALVGVGIVLVALLGLAVMHAVLIGGQLRLDSMRRDVAAEQEQIRRLELRVAELESPDRVLEVARERLGMVEPEEVGYLLPAGIDTGTEGPVRVAPAEVSAEPEAPADGADGTNTDDTAGTNTDDTADTDTADTADTDEPDEPADDAPARGGRDE